MPRDLGFDTIHCVEVETLGVAGVIGRMRERLGDRPIYVSVDIDVLDPAPRRAQVPPRPAA